MIIRECHPRNKIPKRRLTWEKTQRLLRPSSTRRLLSLFSHAFQDPVTFGSPKSTLDGRRYTEQDDVRRRFLSTLPSKANKAESTHDWSFFCPSFSFTLSAAPSSRPEKVNNDSSASRKLSDGPCHDEIPLFKKKRQDREGPHVWISKWFLGLSQSISMDLPNSQWITWKGDGLSLWTELWKTPLLLHFASLHAREHDLRTNPRASTCDQKSTAGTLLNPCLYNWNARLWWCHSFS